MSEATDEKSPAILLFCLRTLSLGPLHYSITYLHSPVIWLWTLIQCGNQDRRVTPREPYTIIVGTLALLISSRHIGKQVDRSHIINQSLMFLYTCLIKCAVV